MQIVIANVHSKEGSEAAMSDVLTKLASASRHDDGCRSYQVLADLENPTHFSTIEMWESADEAAQHMRTPHVAAALGSLEGIVAGAPEITMHEVTSSTNMG